MSTIPELFHKRIIKIEGNVGSDELLFYTEDYKCVTMLHHQDCCESVSIEDITGDLNDLVGEVILKAEEETKDDGDSGEQMWTFYKLASKKGYVDIRWFGSSNGYYSIGVSIEQRDMTPAEIETIVSEHKKLVEDQIIQGAEKQSSLPFKV